MLHRKKDGKWNGLGGKLEADESWVEGAVREFHEEAGVLLKPEDFSVLGFIQFPLFIADKNQDWMVAVLTTEAIILDQVPSGKTMNEGTLHWKTAEEISSLELWEGDMAFLPYVFEGRPFQGTIWYQDGRPVRAEIAAL